MIPPKIYFFFTILGIIFVTIQLIFVTIHIVLSFKAIRNSMIQRVFIEKKYPNNNNVGPQPLFVHEKVVYQEDELYIIRNSEFPGEYVFFITMSFNNYMQKKIKNNWKEMWKEDINLCYIDFYSDILFTKSYTIPIEIPPEEIFHFLMVELNSMQTSIQKAVNIILSNSPKV